MAELGKHVAEYENCYRLLGKQLGTAVGHYNSGYKELGKIDKDVLNLTGESVGIDMQLIDKPSQE